MMNKLWLELFVQLKRPMTFGTYNYSWTLMSFQVYITISITNTIIDLQ